MKTTILPATAADMPELMALVNSAYRGPQSRKGWTHEADLIEGTLRADEIYLQEMLADARAVILLYRTDEKLQGCVYLQQRGDKLFLGMLSVAPELQTGGIGKKLMQAAEDHGRKLGCAAIQITVISHRKELVAWYERRGFRSTGETQPFAEHPRFGTPRSEIEFQVMEKEL